ncbi:hypothetical protein MIR68_009580 [Amoeboaphelidium protococcarum]|nr:hypothetical protein MIR68_009580 [Amoeboaphelidium protococcarum]
MSPSIIASVSPLRSNDNQYSRSVRDELKHKVVHDLADSVRWKFEDGYMYNDSHDQAQFDTMSADMNPFYKPHHPDSAPVRPLSVSSQQHTKNHIHTNNDNYSYNKKQGRKDQNYKMTVAGMEERMQRFKINCQEQMQRQLQQQMNEFREKQLALIEQAAHTKYQQQLHAMKQEMYKDVLQREIDVMQKSEVLDKEIKLGRQILEDEMKQQRQEMLFEMEQFRLKDSALQRELEGAIRAAKLEEEQYQSKMSAAHEKAMEAQRLKDSYQVRLRDEMLQYQLKFDKEHARELEQAKAERIHLESERQSLKERSLNFEFLKSQLEELKQKNASLQKELESNKTAMKNLKHDNEQLMRVNSSYEQQVKQWNKDQDQLSLSRQQEFKQFQTKIQNLEQVCAQRSSEVATFGQRLKDSLADSHRYRKLYKRYKSEHESLAQSVQSLIMENQNLQSGHDESYLKIQNLQRELTDCKVMLKHAQSALNSNAAGGLAAQSLRQSQMRQTSPVPDVIPPLQNILQSQK